MQFYTVFFTLAAASSAYAVDHIVKVGDGGSLAFNPTNIITQSGDNVIFEFRAKNHSVTQSSFANPCSPLPGGFASQFQPVTTTSPPFPQSNITVTTTSAPLWFYCAQKNPINHCHSGMVFAINPTLDKTFIAFQAAANASNSNGITVSSSSSLFPSMSIIGDTSRTLRTVETTSLPSTASALSSNHGSIAPPNNSSGADNENTLSKASVGAIVGGIVGGSALVIFIIIFLLRCGRRRKLSATAHKITPQQPGCTPYTYLSSADIDTRRSQEATRLFMPIEKHRKVISVPSPEIDQSFVASATTNSNVTGIPFQHTVREKASGIEAGFAVSEDFLSGSSNMYQEMRAEIERLQAQLATSGFMDELPRYSRT